jgi:predicted dehydrogenase
MENLQQARRNVLKSISIGIGSSMLSWPLTTLAAGLEDKKKDKLGIALVGLGQYSANQLAPALLETKNCYLAGVVTGTPSKIPAWQKAYDIPDGNIYNYENFDTIIDNKDIDIVYVVLPISMHKEFTIRAAKAKKHVICEKPMAMNVAEAEEMVQACKANGVKLAIGYRLHFEPYNLKVMELGQEEKVGKIIRIEAVNNSDKTNGNPDVWRLRKNLAGGGPLMDMGIYCVQGACYTLGKLPVAVTARYGEVTKPSYFYEVEESIKWEMEFEDGVKAVCESSYHDEDAQGLLKAEGSNGWFKIDPAYAYDDKGGETNSGEINLPNIFEQVAQMDGQAASFRNGSESKVPGEMGLNDMKILMAIYQSADQDGKRIPIQY